MNKKKFIKIVKYNESMRAISKFGIENRFQKIMMIFMFIILFPLTAFVSWCIEFTRLCSIKREVYYREKNEKNN